MKGATESNEWLQELEKELTRKNKVKKKLRKEINVCKPKVASTLTSNQCQRMIDDAIDRHNKTATIISASIGSVLLFFYAQGRLLR